MPHRLLEERARVAGEAITRAATHLRHSDHSVSSYIRDIAKTRGGRAVKQPPPPPFPSLTQSSHQGLPTTQPASGFLVSGTLLPPCNARFEPQDANRLWH